MTFGSNQESNPVITTRLARLLSQQWPKVGSQVAVKKIVKGICGASLNLSFDLYKDCHIREGIYLPRDYFVYSEKQVV